MAILPSANRAGSAVIAVGNQKGGVGKTTSAGYVAVGLAESGRRTLVVDLDHQGHVTRWLLSPDAYERNQGDIVPALLHGAPLDDVILPTQWPGLDLAPASPNMAAVEAGLVPVPKREERLTRALAQLGDRYAYIVLDCPPSAALIAQNALAAADWILAPVEASNFAIAGLGDFYRWVEAMREYGVHDAQWLGLLPTKYDARQRISRELVPVLTGLGIPVLAPIPRRVGIEDLVADRAVATERRLPELAEAYHLAVEHVIRTVENGRPLVLDGGQHAQGA
jgi:chromosome partitioning protein